ncbi:MAG: LacI family DNA-binding transcriptional regulator [Treponema sp.]|nr:LacI family DNA-binding transcriptional regulator [Treponema sp.]
MEEPIAVTARDIARLAGVSVSTVSRSLNGSPRISAETRERIKRLAAELDFEFDASARSLSTRRSGTVALVCPGFLDRFASTLYLNMLIYDIRSNLASRDLDCIIAEAEAPGGQSNIRRLVLQRKVDGILLLLASTLPEDWSVIKKRGIPVIQVHYAPAYFAAERVDYYFTDNILGGRMAAEALLDSGGERIICLSDRRVSPEMTAREKGYREALRSCGIAVDERLVLAADNSFDEAYACVRRNIALARRSDGLFAATDIMALGALRAMADEGLDVPGDFKVVGYDDLEIGTYVRPTLSSVHQPREEIARLACERLAALLHGPVSHGVPGGPSGLGVEQRLIAPTLIRRESC